MGELRQRVTYSGPHFSSYWLEGRWLLIIEKAYGAWWKWQVGSEMNITVEPWCQRGRGSGCARGRISFDP
jgi:hypothetical protein